ncbi:hypothetical protein [Rhodoferax aquaticus]|uniref:hypothetical protein n=1 Tax=Rhodoferax aquaticus TaxID=2527691 RepID=UPI0015A7DE56|nr:hypothetical protein [Rhodoferax aquaticus]
MRHAFMVFFMSMGLGFAGAQAQSTNASSSAKPAPVKRLPAKAKAAPVPAIAAFEAISEEQMLLADRVHVGELPCELDARVHVSRDTQMPGRFFVQLGRERRSMIPVATSTGAVRLEDVASGWVWLQLANKSMLMNQKQGKRLADACMSPEATAVAKAMESAGGPGLLDAPIGTVATLPVLVPPAGQGVATATK